MKQSPGTGYHYNTRVTLCVAVLAQRATMPTSCPVLNFLIILLYAQAFMRVHEVHM